MVVNHHSLRGIFTAVLVGLFVIPPTRRYIIQTFADWISPSQIGQHRRDKEKQDYIDLINSQAPAPKETRKLQFPISPPPAGK